MQPRRQALVPRLFGRFLLSVVIYTVLLYLFLVIGSYIGHNVFVWQSNNPFYSFLQWLDNNAFLLFLFLWGLGCLGLVVRYLRKTVGYVDQISRAVEQVFTEDDALVQLPGELKPTEERLNQIKYDLVRSQQLAKEAEQRKNDLVVYLAHDLKTPLTSVIGYLTLLRDEQQISPELREKYLSISVEKAERLEDLINEFFEITRFNLQELTLDLSTVNLTRMLEQMADEFRPLLTPKGLTYSLTAPPEMHIRADAKKLERVFDNLLRNAIFYSYEQTEITIHAEQDERGVTLLFKNHGDTIPPHKLERIFEQFYRLDSARATQTGGAGLGLAIAKEIVELHHGTIIAQSEADIIRFTVFLPNTP